MDGGAHRLAEQAQDDVHREGDETHHECVAWIDEAVEALSVFRRELSQAFPARIDVEHSVERHDVGRGDRLRQLDEVAMPVGDAATVAATVALLSRRIEIGRGRVDARRAGQTGVEQLVLDSADPASDVE